MPAQLQHAPSSSSLHQAGGIQAARGVSALAEICAPPPSCSAPVGRGCPLLWAGCTEATQTDTQETGDAGTRLMPRLEK